MAALQTPLHGRLTTFLFVASLLVAGLVSPFGGGSAHADEDLGRFDRALQKLAKRVKPSIVTVRVVALSESESQTSTLQEMNRRVLYRASGLISESSGEIATIFGSGLWEYDLDPSERLGLEVELHDGELQIGKLIAHDQDTGIALLSMAHPPKKLRPVRYAKSLPEQGATVFSIGADGFAMGHVAHPARGIAHRGASLPRGIVTTIDAQPGDVGGMLVNRKGELVGILAFSLLAAGEDGETGEAPEQYRDRHEDGRVAKDTGVYDRERRPDFGEFGAAKVTMPRDGGPLGRSVAIPVDLFDRIINALRDDGAMTRGALGATFQFHHPAFTENSHIGAGARVRELVAEGSAQAAGLRIDDVIQKVEGRALKRPEDLLWFRERVEYGQIGQRLHLSVARLERGRIVSKSIRVPIGVRPEGSRGDDLEDPPQEPDCEGGVSVPGPGCPPAPSEGDSQTTARPDSSSGLESRSIRENSPLRGDRGMGDSSL